MNKGISDEQFKREQKNPLKRIIFNLDLSEAELQKH